MLHQIGFGFCVLCRLEIFFPGPWAGNRRTVAATCFLWNHRKQERHCASSLCNYHVHFIRNIQICSFRDCCCWWHKEVNWRWLHCHLLKWVQRHLSYRGYDMLRPVIPFSHWHVHLDNSSCLIELHSRTVAVIRLRCACKRTECCHCWLYQVFPHVSFTFKKTPNFIIMNIKGNHGCHCCTQHVNIDHSLATSLLIVALVIYQPVKHSECREHAGRHIGIQRGIGII